MMSGSAGTVLIPSWENTAEERKRGLHEEEGSSADNKSGQFRNKAGSGLGLSLSLDRKSVGAEDHPYLGLEYNLEISTASWEFIKSQLSSIVPSAWLSWQAHAHLVKAALMIFNLISHPAAVSL